MTITNLTNALKVTGFRRYGAQRGANDRFSKESGDIIGTLLFYGAFQRIGTAQTVLFRRFIGRTIAVGVTGLDLGPAL